MSKQTYQQLFDSAMLCHTREEAEAWLHREVNRHIKLRHSSDEKQSALSVIRGTLGYMAGYCDNSVRDKMRDLFDATHPIFGDTRPTPEQAFAIGLKMGEESRLRGKLAP